MVNTDESYSIFHVVSMATSASQMLRNTAALPVAYDRASRETYLSIQTERVIAHVNHDRLPAPN